jgi:hypothetical protein
VRLRRGDVWNVTGRQPRNLLVVSAGMYNEQPSIPTVLTMPVITAEVDESWCVPIGQGDYAVVDRISHTVKALFAQYLRTIDVQALTDVNNALFRILSTN